ncbi:MAG: acetyl-CoA synthase subunit gamma [Deltaproteobacteria bacterium]|nr:acetyl-CoA synthase subunit gamma [Deltaproteobacteria bacterium]NIS77408.1 acetyl-CoA synthase subunit gamma [Deltaproteobacteria bacterium]
MPPGGIPTRPWVAGSVATEAGSFPRVSTELSFSDRLGSWRVRWGIGRMRYRVEPGLYAVGRPAKESPVLVTANYKLTFDRLRSRLGKVDAWILVLDTGGINVWCAAGGGEFSTGEIVSRADRVRLAEVVAHRTLVLPQLSAPGVSAHEVKARSGFSVAYGPIRAEDLPEFLAGDMVATPDMRRVTFGVVDRAVLIPVELVLAGRYVIPAALAMFFLSGFHEGAFSLELGYGDGWTNVLLLLGGYLGGAVLTPLVLPFVPGRAFSLKGALTGAVLAALYLLILWRNPGLFPSRLVAASWLFIIPALSSFLAMNYTGSTPFTSLSGVRREMKVALPLQIAFSSVGLAMWVAGRFI